MKTSKMAIQKTLMTGVCALALFSVILSPQSAYSTNESAVTQKAATQVEQSTQGQTAEKRKQLTAEAVAALSETRNALSALDAGKSKEALAALERTTGKLELILARDPTLALAPTSVGAATYDVYGTADAVKQASKEAESLLEDGKVQEARHILRGLASETVINVTNIPLATYPLAIKEAVRLIDAGNNDEAKGVLQAALNTLVITETVIPLPVVTAQQLLKEAETLAEKKDRTEADNKRLTDLLGTARAKIDMAQVLGYGTKKDFASFYKELSLIEEETSDGKSGVGFFDKIKSAMSGMFDSSQHENQPQTSSTHHVTKKGDKS